MSITLGYLIIGLMCFVVLYYSVQLWREQRNALSLLILIPLVFLWIDNISIAGGRYIGEGPLLNGITYILYFWHCQMLPLLMIVAGMLLRRGGFAFAQNKFVMGAFCVVAVYFMYLDVPYILDVEFYPACYGDTFRLALSVSSDQVCAPGDSPIKGISVAPIPAISVSLAIMITGILLWIRHGFYWLALTSIFMFIAAGLQQAPGFYYGPLLGNFGEPIFNAGLIAAGYRFGNVETA